MNGELNDRTTASKINCRLREMEGGKEVVSGSGLTFKLNTSGLEKQTRAFPFTARSETNVQLYCGRRPMCLSE
jgi:hypothetical protein